MIVHISHTDYSNTNPTLFLKKRLYNVEEFVIKKKKITYQMKLPTNKEYICKHK
jgi:hypothetical protein